MSEGKQTINPPGLFNATALGFSQAVRVGETLYCSGQVSMSGGTLEEQCRDAFLNVRRLDGWSKTAAVRSEFLKAPFPAVTFVVVRALASPRINVEIDVTAVIGAGR